MESAAAHSEVSWFPSVSEVLLSFSFPVDVWPPPISAELSWSSKRRRYGHLAYRPPSERQVPGLGGVAAGERRSDGLGALPCAGSGRAPGRAESAAVGVEPVRRPSPASAASQRPDWQRPTELWRDGSAHLPPHGDGRGVGGVWCSVVVVQLEMSPRV